MYSKTSKTSEFFLNMSSKGFQYFCEIYRLNISGTFTKFFENIFNP